jgi:hypothetical protein
MMPIAENLNRIQFKSGVKSVLTIEFIKWRRIGVAIESHFIIHGFCSNSFGKNVIFILREKSWFKIE